MADELATALARAGVAVARQPRAARYRLTGVMRGWSWQTRLTLRLIEVDTGRHLWAHCCRRRHRRGLGASGTSGDAHRRGPSALPAPRRDRSRPAEAGRPSSARTTWRSGPCPAFCRSMPREMRARSTCSNARWRSTPAMRWRPRSPPGRTSSASSIISPQLRWRSVRAAPIWRARRRPSPATRRGWPCSATPSPCCTTSRRRTSSSAGRSRSTAARPGPGAATAGSTSTRATPNRPSSGSRSRSTSRRTTLCLQQPGRHRLRAFRGRPLSRSAHWQERALAEHPSATWIHRTLCPAYVLGGAKPEAQRSLAALQDRYPGLTVSEVQQGLPPMSASYCDRLFDALHTVGLPA